MLVVFLSNSCNIYLSTQIHLVNKDSCITCIYYVAIRTENNVTIMKTKGLIKIDTIINY